MVSCEDIQAAGVKALEPRVCAENIKKIGLSGGCFGWVEGGEVFLEAGWVGKHITTSLYGGCKVGCHNGAVENVESAQNRTGA